MVDHASGLKCSHNVTREVLDSDVPVALLHGRDVYAVNSAQPARLYDTSQLVNDESEVLKELIIGMAVSKVCGIVAVAVQIRKRRTEHAEVNASGWYCL